MTLNCVADRMLVCWLRLSNNSAFGNSTTKAGAASFVMLTSPSRDSHPITITLAAARPDLIVMDMHHYRVASLEFAERLGKAAHRHHYEVAIVLSALARTAVDCVGMCGISA